MYRDTNLPKKQRRAIVLPTVASRFEIMECTSTATNFLSPPKLLKLAAFSIMLLFMWDNANYCEGAVNS